MWVLMNQVYPLKIDDKHPPADWRNQVVTKRICQKNITYFRRDPSLTHIAEDGLLND